MKSAFFAGVFLCAQVVAQGADTAYSALRVIGKRDGQEVLNHVLELRGRDGMPQPVVWKVTIDEPRARGGVREIEVQRGKIISERTPTSRSAGSPMNFSQLNLDSEGAFTIANQEAQKAGAPFDHVDYLLKSGTGGGAPVWELSLFEGRGGRVGSIEIAADSGTILRQQLGRSASNPDRDYVDDRRAPVPPPPDDSYRGETAQSGEQLHGVPGFFQRVGKHFERRGVEIKNFFTGRDLHDGVEPRDR